MASRATETSVNHNFFPAGDGQYGASQFLGGVTSQKLAKRARTDGKHARGRDQPEIAGAVEELLGDSILTPVMSRNLDLVQGYPHSTTGIPYAIQGTAKVIQVGVSEYLASFSDPIKTILGTSIHREAKVIITRKFVVGGRSLITPEHAPARTVAIQEDAREVMMTRYGGDIEMNLNLFLRPEDAKEELDLKIAAQRRELERTLVEHGYNVLMEEGTDIVDAIIRSNPSYSTETGARKKDIQLAAERINMSTVFGAMSKNSFPIQNLMAAAKYASAYSTSNQKGSVLLLPHASTDLLRSTRRENMVYSISGPDLLQRNRGKPIDMEFEDSYVDPATNVRIVIHRPFPTFQSGVANPDVGPGPLTDVVSFASYYTLPANTDEIQIVDFHNRCWKNLGLVGTMLTSYAGDLRELKTSVETAIETGRSGTSIAKTEDGLKLILASLLATFKSAESAHDAAREDASLRTALHVATLAVVAVTGMIAAADDATAKATAAGGTKTAFNYDAALAAAVGPPSSGGMGPVTKVLLRPRMNAVMSSGILAAPGAETGELLIGYPFTSVSTSSTEIVKIQLRVYLGAVMKRPENVILLRNIFFEGLREGSGVELFNLGDDDVSDRNGARDEKDLTIVEFPTEYLNRNSKIDYADFCLANIRTISDPRTRAAYFNTYFQLIKLGMMNTMGSLDAEMLEEGIPTVVYQGTCRCRTPNGSGLTKEWSTEHDNNGHLGILDDPKMADRLFGTFAYSDSGPR